MTAQLRKSGVSVEGGRFVVDGVAHPLAVVAPSVAQTSFVQVHRGMKGDKGDAGEAASLDWADIQNKPPQSFYGEYTNTNLIVATHNMGKYPAAHFEDSAGTKWFPRTAHYPTLNEAVFGFDTLFTGKLFLS